MTQIGVIVRDGDVFVLCDDREATTQIVNLDEARDLGDVTMLEELEERAESLEVELYAVVG